MNQPLFESPLIALLLLFPLSLLLLLSTKIRGNSKKKISRVPPSPPKLPFIGNLHQVGSLPHHSLHALSKKHGPLMLLQLGQVPTLVVSSPEIAQGIMRTNDLIFASRPPSKIASILFYGSSDLGFAPYGEYWRQARKICVSHLLSARMVQCFQQAKVEEVELMLEKISRASSSVGVVNMSEVLNSFSNDVICRAVSGKFSRKEGRNNVFRELVAEGSALLGAFHVADYFPLFDRLNISFGLNARAERSAKRWDDLLEDVIKNHAERPPKDDNHDHRDFTDVLLSLQKDPDVEFSLNRSHVKALLMDMFGAGTDTSYILMEWALAELVRKPEAMKKLQDEVRGIGREKAMVREEDLSRMSYLKAVIKEALRLHPPAPLLVIRESIEDCEIQGYHIPKKTRVIVNGWAIGRDPKFWEAADEFQPERFINSSVDFKGTDFQFIPFGAGRRICPGMNFAVSTVELALANLVHRFDWELPPSMTRDDVDMADAPGLTTRKKQRLHLVAKLPS